MRKQIVCFGDSNTWGFDARTETRFSEEIRWTSLLASMLEEDYKVIEEGLSGRTSVMEDPLFEGVNGLTYLTPCLKSHSPLELVIIMLGTNDTKERFGLTAYNIAQGLIRLAQKAKHSMTGINSKNPQVLVISPPIIGEKYSQTKIGNAMGEGCAKKSFELSEFLEKMLQAEQIEFLNASSIPMNTIDFMHLDEEGHKLLAQLVFNKIKKIL